MKIFNDLKFFLFGIAIICLIAENVQSFDCQQVTIYALLGMVICYELTKKSS